MMPFEDNEPIELVEYLIRNHFDSKKSNQRKQLLCIKAAEEVSLNDLAEQMKSDYKFINS